MSEHPTLTTSRLLLRPWRDADRAPFAAMSADPQVMEFFPKLLDWAESDSMVDRIENHFVRHGFGLWAVEVPDVAPFAGFVGLWIPEFETHFSPFVEVGWRLARAYWGLGYASEAAQGALEFGFRQAELDEIVSMTAVANHRSRRVMQRIGMTHTPADDFDHPKLAADHPLCRHVLYRLPRTSWQPTS
jgi:RimJ/RimL family protein N-acetyltransferase